VVLFERYFSPSAFLLQFFAFSISAVTGQPYNFSMLTWKSSDIGYFNPLIQQKRMYTGKGQTDVPQEMLQYRGVPFTSKQYGILNVTGINEAVAFGMGVNSTLQQLTWDSVLSRAVNASFTGKAFGNENSS
jgi:hypothetical protein